jgi:hypothetical protein
MAEASTLISLGRWWDYYALRYFVGTVAGALAIATLTKCSASPLYGFGFDLAHDFNKLEIKEIVVISALGFAYCYIASAPMLLLHATRAQIGLNPLRCKWRRWAVTAGVIAIVQVIWVSFFSVNWRSCESISGLTFLTVFGAQVAMIAQAHLNRFKAIISFYAELAGARVGPPQIAGYVESYRHLREHGNAFAILVLEFPLALVLFSTRRPVFAALAVILWVLPSTYSWFIGSLLESRLPNVAAKYGGLVKP